MIKLTCVEPKQDHNLLLRFSNGSMGVVDFSRYVQTETEMTDPLRDPVFFARHFIEMGSLAWPNGFDLSGEGLWRKLKEAGQLRRDAESV